MLSRRSAISSGFFSALAAFAAGCRLCTPFRWPASSATTAISRSLPESGHQSSGFRYPLDPPVSYEGSPLDPRYHRVGDGRRAEREAKGLRLYLNGKDVSKMAYECYLSGPFLQGWANLRAMSPSGSRLRDRSGAFICYSMRGSVQFRQPPQLPQPPQPPQPPQANRDA